MKCPKCDGELTVVKTSVDVDYVEVDLVCDKNDTHEFWARFHEEDLEEA